MKAVEPDGHVPDMHARVLARALLVAGVLLFLLALLADPLLLARFHFRGFPSSESLLEMRRSRLIFAGAGALACLAGLLLRRGPRALRTPMATRVALIGLGCVPLLVLERATRPFVERLTELYAADESLGWRHRASVTDTYWGEPVRINSHGLRGPERAPEKGPGVKRVLFLGDSVVFGLALDEEAHTIPARLERELEAAGTAGVECLNAAVCGWSTWQQLRFLEAEGERWQPDLVLLGFVLNDVTERQALTAFGGATSGAQLAYGADSGWRAWLAESGVYLAVRELRLRRALRRQEEQRASPSLSAYHVILESDSDAVQAAWKLVLPEVEAMAAWCRARTIPFALVVFPYALQLDDPALDAPQWILTSFAQRRALPCLDLLPALAQAARAEGGRTEIFLDGLHPTARGSQLSAREIARFLREGALLP